MTLDTRVLVVWENGSATYFLKPDEQVKLGRHSECEVRIDLPSVSRRHARLVGAPAIGAAPGQLASIEDIGGMNGVRVRGQRIPLNQPIPVGAGDVIELGGGAIVVLHPPRRDHNAPSAGAIANARSSSSSKLRAFTGAGYGSGGGGSEDPMKAVDRLIEVVAQSDLGVLLLGEPGVGKSYAAESIHSRSARARGPLLRISCSTKENHDQALLEADLFGRAGELGDFKGATETKAGLLEAAAGGTVLLDDVGDLPLSTQTKLLTAIETREIHRIGVGVGEGAAAPLDVRFIATTSTDLLRRSENGLFQLDLFYRLNGISIVIPPLRERTGEILRFATRFLNEAAKRANKPLPRLSNEAIGMIIRHPFYGNIRELKNAMERACVLAKGSFIGPEHLSFEPIPAGAPTATGSTSVSVPIIPIASPSMSAMTAITSRFTPIAPTEPPDAIPSAPPIAVPAAPRAPDIDASAAAVAPPPPSSSPLLRDQMTAFERDRIVAALDKCRGNQTKAAEILGMSRRALIARIEQYGLPRPRKR